jgi:adenine-specific DNA-methyltransferase
MARKPKAPKQVETLTHDEAKRKNIPTAELQSAAQRAEEMNPFKPVTYERENPLAVGEKRPRDEDLDPQIVWKGSTLRLKPAQIEQLTQTGKLEIGDAQLTWRGKDQQDWSDLIVQAPPLYIQEKIHPKAIIDNLKRQTKEREEEQADAPDLFGAFNGLPDLEDRTEFYQHDQHWSNRMILGDSLQVMASLAEREGLREKVQTIFFDPPYGISFGSNWQVSTQSRDVKNGKLDQITREPEQVKAFRDTWRDGIHSYLTYLRDRMTSMRDLLTNNGSIFVQIGDANLHHVRGLLDEIFGAENFCSMITFRKTNKALGAKLIGGVTDYIVWYAKDKKQVKFRKLKDMKTTDENPSSFKWVEDSFDRRKSDESDFDKFSSGENVEFFTPVPLTSSGYTPTCIFDFSHQGTSYSASSRKSWATTKNGIENLKKANRIFTMGNTPFWVQYYRELATVDLDNVWDDTRGELRKSYVVQTTTKVVERCILMTTDPGDLVLDPTCGSGTTANVAEQWGRRWITIDTSRVALALARTRLMSSNFPYYLLSDSQEGVAKEQEITGRIVSDNGVSGNIRLGFVLNRIPKVTLKSIANNSEIEVIWENYLTRMNSIRNQLNSILSKTYEEWEVPHVIQKDWPESAKELHTSWIKLRDERQAEIDKSIAQNASVELLFDQPYVDNTKVRVAGPFTVESLSPHRVVPADEDELTELSYAEEGKRERMDAPLQDFAQMVMENLKSAGVHQAARDDRIAFTSLEGWPGTFIAASGTYLEGETEKRAAIFIGPEFGSVTRADLTAAAREALDARFDALIACGFNFDAHSSELQKLGPLPILKAKMNPDLHMSDELKNTGAGNLFVVFGEPDIEWDFDEDGNIIVEVLGVDVFDPKTGEVRASGKDDIAAWFIDTDYDETSFFVRHAYFLGANDPYKSLKTALKAEIDKEAWQTLYRDTSRPFGRPTTGRFAVKVINHFGDEVMKVFGV